MPYTSPTLQQAVDAVAARLSDGAFVRWTQAELVLYIGEALRTWSAWTQSYRARGVADLATMTAIYDLPTLFPALRAYTVTDRDLITLLQYHLLEPPTPTAWTGSQQFTLADLTLAIQRRRDQFLLETGVVVTPQTYPSPPPPQSRVVLAEPTIAVRRAAWSSTSAWITPLRREDDWGTVHYRDHAPQQPQRPPAAYTVSATPPLTLQLAPPPSDTGQLLLLAITRGSELSPATRATVLGIPDDWAWVVKWGALADILAKDGLAPDPSRSAYAEARWREGIAMAQAAAVVLTARINNVVCGISSLLDADRYTPTWQTVPGVPRRVLTLGQNLLGCWPPPGVPVAGGTWALTMDLVANWPVPAGLADPLGVGGEVYDAIVDYAQHLALVKEGAAQLQNSLALVQRAAAVAGVVVDVQQASQPARRPLLGQSTRDQQTSAYRTPAEPVP